MKMYIPWTFGIMTSRPALFLTHFIVSFFLVSFYQTFDQMMDQDMINQLTPLVQWTSVLDIKNCFLFLPSTKGG